ncbi:TetR/AcrR family transcriptional regulator [Psychrobacillus sp. FSL K6-2836]|uniref:TetR/AcrR family transcriptional regulator n=1 Tax=Psychrobacillus sp. FSL K6-2836 TaxID=2921548 RepID=UPI0030FCA6A6
MAEEETLLEQLFDDEKLTDKQKKIILAAIDTFSEKGYAATSTSEIAKKAGVAEGTIFKHYKTKKTLLISIVAPLMTRIVGPLIVKDFHKVLDEPYENVEDFLRATIENRREVFKKLLPVIKILIQEIPFQPELREQFVEQIARKTYERVLEIIVNYQEKGQIIDIPPPSIVRFAVTSIFGYLISRYIFFPNSEWDDELESELTIQFILRGVGTK